MRRNAHIEHTIWNTVHDPAQRYAGGEFPMQSDDLVNAFTADFLGRVAAGAWGPRDARATPGAITGIS